MRDQLRTVDGRSIRILHPGFWNREAGPDFQGAVLQFDQGQALSGDVEIDLDPSCWRAHGHDRNSAFRNVLLHVVWRADRESDSSLPTLCLEGALDAPLAELTAWLGADLTKRMPEALVGQCSAPLRGLEGDLLEEILRQAAQVRLQGKGAQFQARARQVGWEQALWEGLFRALGYKNNVWPFQRLGELVPGLVNGDRERGDPVVLQARLLGLSGLLPSELTRAQQVTDRYLRRIWDHWWREREAFAPEVLPRSVWRFNGLRPANHPQRRLALAAHWLASAKLIKELEKWFTTSVREADLAESLGTILNVETDDYWSNHWTFQSACMSKPQPLLGSQRVTDLAINVVLPWLWIRAVTGGNQTLPEMAERRFFSWPKGEDNAVLRLARERLLGGGNSRLFKTAGAQQGLLQIVRDFCNHSDSLCANCQFPELVRNLSR